ncbi:DUF2398 family protein [Streptomyces sp. BE20]|uniref:DUF2398 family protein n=1 Tax=Streptomyces sp. BE20 TaxID=3002525 RepID=UPI002E7752F2|nr:DUF2398 family protein [Streptomyces sp. BE20]MEE1824507.1 DUF2398 family protein [Streptomyces sp. BE20]
MEQQEDVTGAARAAGGASDGRTGGAGRSTLDAVVAVREAVSAAVPLSAPPAGSRAVSASAPVPARVAVRAPGTDDPQEVEVDVDVAEVAGPAPTPAPPSAPTPAPTTPAPSSVPTPGLSPDPGLLRLAEWFAQADAGTADDLWAASFGLYPARHFGAPAEPGPVGPGPVGPGLPGSAPAEPASDVVSWWHGPTAHTPAQQRTREARPVRGLRRARRDAGALPVVLSGAKPGRPGKHRKPERSRIATVGAQDRSAAATAAERRIAARLLLAHPLVTASGPHADGFPLIRRHRDWLTERFDTLLGYRLLVGPWHARLHKAGLGPGAARRLEHPATGAPFTPGGYARLALALALLVDAPEQLPLGRLRAAMRTVGPEAAPAPDAARADLCMALAVLADWQVLLDVPVDPADPAGDETVLTVDRELARAVPAAPPARAADAADLIRHAAEAEPGTAVRRRLAETPVVLIADLSEERRDWLRDHRISGPAALADFLGLEAEHRAEGVALLDPAEELTDLALPGAGTLAQAALLLVERLVEEVRPLPGESTDADVPVPDALIDGVLGDIADEYGLPAGWRRDYLADRTALRRDSLDLLHRMGLLVRAPRGTRPPGWLLRAPAARYAPAHLLPEPGTGRHSRRDPEITVPAPAAPKAEQHA